MASVKKTMKSSATKRATQAATRSPKSKTLKRPAEEAKRRKAAAAAAKTAVGLKKSSGKKSTPAKKPAGKTAARTRTAAKTTQPRTPSTKAKNVNAKVKTTSKTIDKHKASSVTKPAERKASMPMAATKEKTKAVKRVSTVKSQPRSKGVAQAASRKTAPVVRQSKPVRPQAAKAAASVSNLQKSQRKNTVSTQAARDQRSAIEQKTYPIKEVAPVAPQAIAPIKAGPKTDLAKSLAKPELAETMVSAGTKAAPQNKSVSQKETAAALLAFKRQADKLQADKFNEAGKQITVPPATASSLSASNVPSEQTTVTTMQREESKKKLHPETVVAAGPSGAASEALSATPEALSAKTTPNTPVTAVGAATIPAAKAASLESTNAKPTAAAAKPGKSTAAQRPSFKSGEFVVYPAHGVGQILAIEEQEVAGFKLELYVISFIKDKMILKVPTPKVVSVGMRKLSDASAVKGALDTLAGRARIKRTMWSRRAQEYEAKINSGDLIAIAEVVRDLYRSESQPEQSYSERQLYEAALDRMTREIVVVQKLTETESLKVIEAQLQKGPRRGGKSEDLDSDPDESEIEEAA